MYAAAYAAAYEGMPNVGATVRWAVAMRDFRTYVPAYIGNNTGPSDRDPQLSKLCQSGIAHRPTYVDKNTQLFHRM